MRAQFQVRRRFWEDEGVTGAASTDLFDGRVDRQQYHVPADPDGRAVLEAFMEGPTADELSGRPEGEILEAALEHLEQIHPYPGVRGGRCREGAERRSLCSRGLVVAGAR